MSIVLSHLDIRNVVYVAVESQLDYAECNRHLAKLPKGKAGELEAAINAAVADHIEAGFRFGYEAAKNPAMYVFDDCVLGRPTQTAPDDTFRLKMEAQGFGDDPVLNSIDDDKLFGVICDLLSNADWIAFGVGWKTSVDATWLIFTEAHSPAHE